MLKRCLSLLVPSLLIVGCGDNPRFEEDQDTAPFEGGSPDAGEDAPAPRAIGAGIFIDTITCTETIARFEAGARYLDDNSPALDIACKWTFDDGATSNECTGEHRFAVAGAHDFALEVTDLATGATDTATQTRQFHPPLALTLDISGDDLSLTYAATSNTGGEQVVFVTPAELVIADDPNYPRNTTGTVRVREPGTYTVTYDVEDERGVSEICSGTLVKQITLACGDSSHEH